MPDVTDNPEYMMQEKLVPADRLLMLTASLLFGKIADGTYRLVNRDGSDRPSDDETARLHQKASERFLTLASAANKSGDILS